MKGFHVFTLLKEFGVLLTNQDLGSAPYFTQRSVIVLYITITLFASVLLPNYCPHGTAVRAGRGQAIPVALDSGSRGNAIEPFEADAVDHILKPLSSDRVERSVARAKARLASSQDENYATRLEALAAVQRRQQYQERIVVPVNGRILLVDSKRH
jgi:hypothetical protein